MWRQGDVLVQQIDSIPDGLERLKRAVLATGDSTGHSHKLKDRRAARLFSRPDEEGGELFLEVLEETTDLVHPEHRTIVLPRGCYRIWRQREFDERGNHFVSD